MTRLSTKRVLNEQEQKLLELKDLHKKLLKKIDTERTKLETLKQDIKKFMNSHGAKYLEFIQELRLKGRKFVEVLEQCGKSSKFTRTERNDIKHLKLEIEETLGFLVPFDILDNEEMLRQYRENAEKEGVNFADAFIQFAQPLEKYEEQQIRTVYKRLASQFHPDKGSGNKQLEEQFHLIMQRINKAYKSGDIAELFAIEAQYAQNSLSKDEAHAIQDMVEREMKTVQQQIELYTAQLARLKSERQAIERSPEGKAFKDYKKSVQSGVDPLEQMMQETQTAFKEMALIIEPFEQFLSGKLSRKQFDRELDRQAELEEEQLMEDMSQDFIMFLQTLMEQAEQTQRSPSRSSRQSAKRRHPRRISLD